MSPELLAKIRHEREHGELLGILCDRYGAKAVVAALGVMDVAESLGVCPHKWVTRRMGGSPSDAGSDERVTYCELCGSEPPFEDSLGDEVI